MFVIMQVRASLSARIEFDLPAQVIFHMPLAEAEAELSWFERMTLRAGILAKANLIQELADETARDDIPGIVWNALVEHGLSEDLAHRLVDRLEFQIRFGRKPEGIALTEEEVEKLLLPGKEAA